MGRPVIPGVLAARGACGEGSEAAVGLTSTSSPEEGGFCWPPFDAPGCVGSKSAKKSAMS